MTDQEKIDYALRMLDLISVQADDPYIRGLAHGSAATMRGLHDLQREEGQS